MKLKEINDKIQEVSKKLNGVKDKALRDKLIKELVDFKKTITFESIDDGKDEYGLNESINKQCGQDLIQIRDYKIETLLAYYDLYYKTKMRMGQIEKQYNANVDTFDAVIEALKDPKKIK